MTRSLGWVLTLGTLLAWSSAKVAAEPLPTSSMPANDSSTTVAGASAPDIVRLKDGGILRGTIIELKPSESVSIQLLNGQMRELAMDRVDYAGPASEMPTRSSTSERGRPATPTVHSDEAHLELRADDPRVTFYVYHGAQTSQPRFNLTLIIKNYERLCTAPCAVSLPTGAYRFGLSREGDPVEASDTLNLWSGHHTLVGEYRSRRGVRIAGWVVGLGAMIGGLVWALRSNFEGAGVWGPLALIGGGAIAGTIMVRIGDKAIVTLE